MKFLLVAVMLAAPALAQVDRFSLRWAREEARIARLEAQRQVRQAQREGMRLRIESRHAVLQMRLEAGRERREVQRESQRYRQELLRDLRQNFRSNHPDTTGMKRIF